MNQDPERVEFDRQFEIFHSLLMQKSEFSQKLAYLVSLPQCILRMKHARYEGQRAQRDAQIVFEMLTRFLERLEQDQEKGGSMSSLQDLRTMKLSLERMEEVYRKIARKMAETSSF